MRGFGNAVGTAAAAVADGGCVHHGMRSLLRMLLLLMLVLSSVL